VAASAPEYARWNPEWQAVEFGGRDRRVPRRGAGPEARLPAPTARAAHPHERRDYHLQRTRFESIAKRKLRRRQLTEDGNVEISGRDFR